MFKSQEPKQEPSIFLIFGLPKIGKTTAIAELPDCAIVDIDFDGGWGTDYIKHDKVAKITTLEELGQLMRFLAANPQKFLAIDTITGLERLLSEKVVKEFNARENARIKSVEEIQWGAGTAKLRELLMDTIFFFKKQCERLILVAHIKYKNVIINGLNLQQAGLNLNGKNAEVVPAFCSSIALLHREKGTLKMTFEKNDEISITGSRIKRLQGEQDFNWEIIYPETLGGKNDK